MDDEYKSPLSRAIALWNAGKHIPMDLAVALMAEGYDLPALQRAHFNPS